MANTRPKRKDTVIYDALYDLDNLLSMQHAAPLKLSVVSTFALNTGKDEVMRDDKNAYPSLSFLGANLSPEVQEAVKLVGFKHNLGADWLNNDLVLSGVTIEDLEIECGKLEFEPANLRLHSIDIESATPETVLKLYILAIDTELFGFYYDTTAAFTRESELHDIINITKEYDIDLKDFLSTLQKSGLIVHEDTARLILDYERTGRIITRAEAGIDYDEVDYDKQEDSEEYDEELAELIDSFTGTDHDDNY